MGTVLPVGAQGTEAVVRREVFQRFRQQETPEESTW